MAQKCDQIMIDLETLATGADAVILSIGAVKFNVDGMVDDKAFYASCSIDSQRNRHISEQTLIWWMGKSDDARKVFKEPKVTLEAAMISFVNWFDHGKYCVWSNGADFDIPMVKHALDSYNIAAPWEFYNQRCFRTLKSIPPGMYAPKPTLGIAHNALDDALNQVRHLQHIYASSKPGAPRQEKSFVKQS